jgi:hypothetical protein
MAHSHPIPRVRLRLSFAAGAVLTLWLPACAPDGVLEAEERDCATTGACADPLLEGDDPATLCDDHDPCTTDADCTPCSTLSPSEQDLYHCTADGDLPPFCAGRTGCVHVPLTTPAGQIDSCFPVAGASDLRSGVCRAGACVDDE